MTQMERFCFVILLNVDLILKGQVSIRMCTSGWRGGVTYRMVDSSSVQERSIKIIPMSQILMPTKDVEDEGWSGTERREDEPKRGSCQVRAFFAK